MKQSHNIKVERIKSSDKAIRSNLKMASNAFVIIAIHYCFKFQYFKSKCYTTAVIMDNGFMNYPVRCSGEDWMYLDCIAFMHLIIMLNDYFIT